ncbi:MAG: hypothetical protein MJ005_01305 [Methanocorpusculum sp.]|nr:hypothetical protein [Methanocorpusculum sp.]HJJ44264.1 hypothetical protein [Methanocorpusculum sp.]
MYTNYADKTPQGASKPDTAGNVHDVIRSSNWKVFPNKAAIRQIDSLVLKQKGCEIPPDIRFFFNVDELQLGQHRLLHLINNHNEYRGQVIGEKESWFRKSIKTTMVWSPKLGEEMQRFYDYHGARSVLIFRRIAKNTYLVDFGLEADEKLWFASPDEEAGVEAEALGAQTAAGSEEELYEDAEEPEKPWDASEPERAVTVDKISANPDEIRNLYLEQGLLYFVGSKDVIQNKDRGLGYLTTAKNMGCADASYLLDTENPNGRINLYAALHGYAYARRNLESWQSTAKWRLTSDEWREFYTAFHPEKIEEEERKRKEEEELEKMREEEVRKHRQNANVDSQSVSIEQEEPYIIHSFSWSIYNNSLAVKKLDKTTIRYNESPIPLDIAWFFNTADLTPGFYNEIQLQLSNTMYAAKIHCKYRYPSKPHSNVIYEIMWESSLKEVVDAAFNAPQPGTPAISFRKTADETIYECSFYSVLDDDTLVDIFPTDLAADISKTSVPQTIEEDVESAGTESPDVLVEPEPVEDVSQTVDTLSAAENTVVDKLYDFIEAQPHYSPAEISNIPINDGIFFLLDGVEKYNNHDRIMYIGVNHRSGNLNTLLQTTLFGNKNTSVLRKYIGAANLLKKKDVYWRIWLKDTSNARGLRKVGTFYNPDREKEIENAVSNYIRKQFKVVCISYLTTRTRKDLQTKIINSLKSVYLSSQLSENWLGKSAHDDRISNYGLWEFGPQDVESQLSYDELEEIIFSSDGSTEGTIVHRGHKEVEPSSDDKGKDVPAKQLAPTDNNLEAGYSGEFQWTFINETCVIKKIDSGTVADGRTALTEEMLEFFGLDRYSRGSSHDINVINADGEYRCIIRRLSQKGQVRGSLYIISWNHLLHTAIKIFFLSGMRNYIAFSKTNDESTYKLEIIKDADEYKNNLPKSEWDAGSLSVHENENPDQSAESILSPLLRRREKVIKTLFDKEETNVRKTLLSHYQYGFNINSFIELTRFKNAYYADFGVEYAGDEDQLKSEIQASGMIFEGKIYCVSLEAIEKLQQVISDAESAGVEVIYYEKFYSKNSGWLFDGFIMSAEMLKEILNKIYPTFSFGQNYFLLSPHKVTEKDAVCNEILRIWGNQQLRTEEELNERLPYLPEDKIKSTLSTQNIFVWNSRYTYARRDLFHITEEEISALRNAVLSLCTRNGNATFDELPLENITAENFELSETALYDMVFSYLADDYERTKTVITVKGETQGTKGSIVEFCKRQETCTLSELKDVLLQTSGSADSQAVASMLEAANSVMVRITDEIFVSDEKINFDTQNIDAALDTLVPNEICGIKEIPTFSLFPSCGFEWNLFILESYCRRFSDKYRYVSPRANSQNIGAIVKIGNTTDYHQIMAEAVAHSSVELNEAEVFDYLIEAGFLVRRRYTRMDELINAAKDLR